MGLGLYIHIPFCRSKCVYCDFYSLSNRQKSMDTYQCAVMKHLEKMSERVISETVDTIYFGGGTPSFCGGEWLVQLLDLMTEKYRLNPQVEITVEANPDSVTIEDLKVLHVHGVNRLSIGMQSADNRQLRDLGRTHTFEQTCQAVEAARQAGFDNISLDIIYGLPMQDMDSWAGTLEKAISLGPEHISAYGLTVEENTPLARRVQSGEKLPDEDTQAEFYLQGISQLGKSGYEQYEISNFARPGHESRHNLKYWTLEPYLGFGPGAHSDFGGRRFSWARDMDGYINNIMTENFQPDEDIPISERERANEYLMLRLRTTQGISANVYSGIYGLPFTPVESKMREFREYGWAQELEGKWSLTPKGFLLSNQLIGQVLEAQESVHQETGGLTGEKKIFET